MDQSLFTVAMGVRDYELDMQGVVNNSVYQNYLEHARHEYLHSLGLNFAAFAERKINLVVVRAELDYKASLVSGDQFTVSCALERVSPVRFGFRQVILRSDGKVVMHAFIIGTALNARMRPELPEEFVALLGRGQEGGLVG